MDEEFFKMIRTELKRLKEELKELRFLKYEADTIKEFRKELIKEKWD